jgi:hypothetical protein
LLVGTAIEKGKKTLNRLGRQFCISARGGACVQLPLAMKTESAAVSKFPNHPESRFDFPARR